MSLSYAFANQSLSGSFTSTYPSSPLTLALFFKMDVHPAALRAMLFFGNSNASIDDSQALQCNTTLDQYGAFSRTTSNVSANFVVNENGLWTGLVGVFTNDSLRDVYVGNSTNTATNAALRAVANVMQFLRVGQSLAGGAGITGKMAELAIWNKALSTGEIRDYTYGIKASTISPLQLIGYWPLSSANANQANQGVDAGGTLAVSGATFDTDHPNITIRAPMYHPRRVYLPN